MPPADPPENEPIPVAPLPGKLTDFYSRPLREYGPIYGGAVERTVKRWVSDGRHSSPPDLPPLDNPRLMAAWWRRHKTGSPPAVFVQYELSPPPPSPVPPVTPVAGPPSPPDPVGTPDLPVAPIPPPSASSMPALDLTGMSVEEGESVRQARSIVAANYRHVVSATALGDADAYRRWCPLWSDASETLRKLEKEDREARKASGSLIPRGEVLAELSQLMETLRIMRDTMPSRVLSEMAKTDHPTLRRVLRILDRPLRLAIAKVREGESAIFGNLESLSSPEAVREALAA